MTLIELSGVFFAFIGAVLGAFWGFSSAGLLGLAVGLVIGCLCGLVFGTALVLLFGYFGGMRERLEQRKTLRSRFGAYWRRSKLQEWRSMKESLTPSTQVEGVVVATKYYGVFLDIGVGFPALLSWSKMAADTVQEPSKCPSLEQSVKAWVQEFNESGRFVELTQGDDTTWVLYRQKGVGLVFCTPKPLRAGDYPYIAFDGVDSEALQSALDAGTSVRCTMKSPNESAEWIVQKPESDAISLVRQVGNEDEPPEQGA